MTLGFGNVDVYMAETAFHRWRDDPLFRDMPARLRAVSRPCERRESRQLDYWVGTWEQQNLNGVVLGETEYRGALSGCALVGGRIVYRNTMVRETDDRIRWRFGQSDDGGRKWRMSFDGFYVRKRN